MLRKGLVENVYIFCHTKELLITPSLPPWSLHLPVKRQWAKALPVLVQNVATCLNFFRGGLDQFHELCGTMIHQYASLHHCTISIETQLESLDYSEILWMGDVWHVLCWQWTLSTSFQLRHVCFCCFWGPWMKARSCLRKSCRRCFRCNSGQLGGRRIRSIANNIWHIIVYWNFDIVLLVTQRFNWLFGRSTFRRRARPRSLSNVQTCWRSLKCFQLDQQYTTCLKNWKYLVSHESITILVTWIGTCLG